MRSQTFVGRQRCTLLPVIKPFGFRHRHGSGPSIGNPHPHRALSTAPRETNAHQDKGWEQVTEQAIQTLVARGKPPVAVSWGGNARGPRRPLHDVPCVESVHPSPRPADRAFSGSRPFSRTDELLVQQGASPVNRRLP